MISAILARIAPYALILLALSSAGDILLGKELLSKQEALGEAVQNGNTRVATQALQSSEAARTAQTQADADTIKQLRQSLGRETDAAHQRQHDLDQITAANTALNQEIANVNKLSPDAQRWGESLIPDVVLDAVGLCWYTGDGNFSGSCSGP